MRVVCLILVAASLRAASGVCTIDDDDVVRLRRLSRGVNLGHYLAQLPSGNYLADAAARFNSQDIKTIKQLGYNHVRLPIEESLLMDANMIYKASGAEFDLVKATIDAILSENLAVIVDFHPTSSWKTNLYASASLQAKFALFWGNMTTSFKTYNHNSLFFEVFNEPSFVDPTSWNTLSHTLIAAIQAVDPARSIIIDANLLAAENDWNTYKALESMTPPPSSSSSSSSSCKHVIYTIHMYEPSLFTHQGAEWGWEGYLPLHDLPYPSSSARVASLVANESDATVRGRIQYYGDYGWDRDKVWNVIKRAFEWAVRHNVPLLVTEFGVYRKSAPSVDTADWYRDMTQLFEEHGVGWTMWEADYGFGLFRQGMTGSASLSSGKTLDSAVYNASIRAFPSSSMTSPAMCNRTHVRPRRSFASYPPQSHTSSFNWLTPTAAPFAFEQSATPLLGLDASSPHVLRDLLLMSLAVSASFHVSVSSTADTTALLENLVCVRSAGLLSSSLSDARVLLDLSAVNKSDEHVPAACAAVAATCVQDMCGRCMIVSAPSAHVACANVSFGRVSEGSFHQDDVMYDFLVSKEDTPTFLNDVEETRFDAIDTSSAMERVITRESKSSFQQNTVTSSVIIEHSILDDVTSADIDSTLASIRTILQNNDARIQYIASACGQGSAPPTLVSLAQQLAMGVAADPELVHALALAHNTTALLAYMDDPSQICSIASSLYKSTDTPSSSAHHPHRTRGIAALLLWMAYLWA